MKKLGKILKGGAIAIFVALLVTVPVFADAKTNCEKKLNVKLTNGTKPSGNGTWIKCGGTMKIGNNTYSIYGHDQAACANAGQAASNPEQCEGDDLNSVIQVIINTIIFAIGMVSVIMIILGGISYATSQGDPAKVKKGKDTILYGIIGLVVALLAFAIVSFVLNALSS